MKNAGSMTEFAYDAVRYSNYPYAQTHPDRLATVAILHGLEPPNPSTGRVLEIGCGAGGNLMAMAASAPGITAVGVDLAAGPIADGQAAIAEIGLRQRRAAPGRRARPRRRPARPVRLRRRPRRLRLDPGARARRAAGDDPGQPRAGWHRVRLLQHPSRRLLPADAARRRPVARPRRRSAGRGRPRREGPGALQVPARAPRVGCRHLRRAARDANCRRSPTARSTGSCTTT